MVTASWIHCLDARSGCVSAPWCAGAAVSGALLYPILDWPALSVACVILSSVRPGKSRSRETAVQPRRGFLQPAVPEGLCGRVLPGCGLAELDAFVHCSNDVCFAQELVRDALSKSDGDSECEASSGNCGDFGHVLHVSKWRRGSRCLLFSEGSAPLRLLRWPRRIPAGRTAPRWGDTECHHRPCTISPQSLRFFCSA